jgi:hypothetical protein
MQFRIIRHSDSAAAEVDDDDDHLCHVEYFAPINFTTASLKADRPLFLSPPQQHPASIIFF